MTNPAPNSWNLAPALKAEPPSSSILVRMVSYHWCVCTLHTMVTQLCPHIYLEYSLTPAFLGGRLYENTNTAQTFPKKVGFRLVEGVPGPERTVQCTVTSDGAPDHTPLGFDWLGAVCFSNQI